MTERPVVIVSNRGPVSFRVDDGELVAGRGGGGLVSGLAPLVAGTDTRWIAAAMTEGDRRAADRGVMRAADMQVRLLALPPDQYRMAYDVVCNATLWFVHHGLFDLARRPRFDERWHQAWQAYRAVNAAFADAVVADAPDDAIVLVHFAHTPFAGPDGMRVLPTEPAHELLEGLAAHHACGFHTARWADSFRESCRALIGVDPTTFVAPLGPAADDIEGVARSADSDAAWHALDDTVADRAVIARVDRIELSKNIVRGFHAFNDLLERFPSWRERVVFLACCYPSREGLAEYLAYRQEVEAAVRAVNERWATPDWTPIVLELSDDFARSVAVLRRYDVLLVNPIRDGLNLVAMEGPLVNERDGLLALSTEAGAWSVMADHALAVHPFDITQTADTLAAALATDPEQRHRTAAALRQAAGARTPALWLADACSAAR